MPNIYKMTNAGGFKSLTRYHDMLAGNTTWNPWEPAGAYESIATINIPSGGAASVTFVGIPQTYAHLQVRSISLFINARMDVTFNSDSSSNYSYHLLQGNGSASYAEAGSNQTSIKIWPNGNATNLSNPNVVVMDLLEYANTNVYKTAKILNGFDQNGSGIVSLNSGNWRSTSAITSITLAPNTGSFAQYSQFALYGIKG